MDRHPRRPSAQSVRTGTLDRSSREPNRLSPALRIVAAVVLITALAACKPDPVVPEVFLPENAWTEPIPDDAEIVTPDELRRLVARGEVTLTSSAIIEATLAEQQAVFEADLEALAGFASTSETLQALLAEVSGVEHYEADRSIELPNGDTVRVDGFGAMLRDAVETHELSLSAENALADYSLAYSLLSEDLQSELPAPAGLTGATLESVRGALEQLEALLTVSYAFQEVRVEDQPWESYSLESAALRPGAGRDMDFGCAHPTGLVSGLWFPLKRFLTPVKNQGERGVCWAFTAIGAIESRERVQNGRDVNLSEQFLVHKVKLDWASSDYTDGYRAESALAGAHNRGQLMIHEAGWTYNPSPNRADAGDGRAAYAGACDPYGNGPDGGSCSETAHQSPRVCSTAGLVTVCGYRGFDARGQIPAGQAPQIWSSGQRFDLQRYRLLLDQGHVLMAALPVYSGFMHAPNGVVSDYGRTVRDAGGNLVPGVYGNHQVLIVGFIPNEAMAGPMRPNPNIGGGGYFIVQNSWGCDAGDGGFYYVPANYVERHFHRLSTLEFDGRRSAAWHDEMTIPGGMPNIVIDTPVVTVDVRVETDLTDFFSITHPVTKSVHLTAYYGGGTIYNGSWSTDRDSIFGHELKHTFDRIGGGELRLDVRYNNRVASASFRVNVVNTPPLVGFETRPDAYVGEPHLITAVIIDPNEPDLGPVCASARWRVDPEHSLSHTSGCQTYVEFSAIGRHEVSLEVTDRDGARTVAVLPLTVGPAPTNPYPRVTNPGVFAIFSAGPEGCRHQAQPFGGTIDLRQMGCTPNPGTPVPPRHYASVMVENPSGETLTYDWQLLTKLNHPGATWQVYDSVTGSSSARMPLRDRYTVTVMTAECRVLVTVKAPQASRNKSLVVWMGQCIAHFGSLPR